MQTTKHRQQLWTIMLILILCIYWLGILRINFSRNPGFYCTDMYSDMIFAAEAWKQKSLFPEGWVFGNQTYVAATPVLAAICFGITQNHCIAMGLASTIMGLSVIVSFTWMLKPVFAERHQRLTAIVIFMSAVLFCGDAVFSINGWQLFFTMCSYYACYAITVFLAFGCFLRSRDEWKPAMKVVFLLTCILSLRTGMQSLRQTAIMVLPMIAAECLIVLHCSLTKRKLSWKEIQITGALTLSNLAGLLIAECISVPKNEIFGSFDIVLSRKIFPRFFASIGNALSLFAPFEGLVLGICCLAGIYVVFVLFRKQDLRDNSFFLFLLLCFASIAVVAAINTVTTMEVRPIYYFMLYPLIAVLITWQYARVRKAVYPVTAFVLILSLANFQLELQPYLRNPVQEEYPMETVGSYLEENGITTVYSNWNFAEKVAIASDCRIDAGFWDAPEDAFCSVKYLCDPRVFDADPSECAYVVCGKANADEVIKAAAERSKTLSQMKYFPELDVYVFRSDENLMQ